MGITEIQRQLPEIYLSPIELAARLKMKPFESRAKPGGVGTLANWRVQGKGPKFVKIGKNKVLYKITEVEIWEQSLQQKSTSDEPTKLECKQLHSET